VQEQAFATGLPRYVPDAVPRPGSLGFQSTRDLASEIAVRRSGEGSLSGGALTGLIVGVVAGGLLLIGAVVGCGCLLLFYRRKVLANRGKNAVEKGAMLSNSVASFGRGERNVPVANATIRDMNLSVCIHQPSAY
jgi:hypothetical protein